jgi:hypothetical protein
MAKAPPPKASGMSRVRFIMVEAEVADAGDLSQITQAIQNALRPAPGAVRIASSTQTRGNGAAAIAQTSQPPLEVDEDETAEEEVESEVAEHTRTSNGPKSPRKFRSPEVLELDLTTEPSFAAFAAERNPTSNQMRYLTVAAWFKLHRQLDAVTADHVYTCYRAVKWQSDIQDFAQPLRDLKFRKLMQGKERGHYAINHLGLQEVEDLTKSG